MNTGKNRKLFLAVLLLFAIFFRNLYADEAAGESVPLYPVNIQVIPGLNIFGHNFEKSTNIFLFGFAVGIGHNLSGIGIAPLGLIQLGDVRGVQMSGIFNTVSGNMMGLQTASLFNYSTGTVMGIQMAGHFNWAKSDTRGVQFAGLFNYIGNTLMGIQVAGLFNYAEQIRGIQIAPINKTKSGVGLQIGVINFSDSDLIIPIGLFNFVRQGMKHPAIYMDDFMFLNFGYRSGTKYFFSNTNFGLGGGFLTGHGDKYLSVRNGHGVEIPINKFFIDIEFSMGTIIIMDSVFDYFFGPVTDIYQLRLSGGWNVFKKLGIFAGVSFDYLVKKEDKSPNPADLGSPIAGNTNGTNTFKFGFFGGLQL